MNNAQIAVNVLLAGSFVHVETGQWNINHVWQLMPHLEQLRVEA